MGWYAGVWLPPAQTMSGHFLCQDAPGWKWAKGPAGGFVFGIHVFLWPVGTPCPCRLQPRPRGRAGDGRASAPFAVSFGRFTHLRDLLPSLCQADGGRFRGYLEDEVQGPRKAPAWGVVGPVRPQLSSARPLQRV